VPKIKTHKTAAKRFSITKTGKLMHRPGGGKGGRSHLRRNRSKAALRQFDKKLQITVSADEKRIKRLVPYLKERERA